MSVGTEPPRGPGSESLQIGDWTVEPALNQLATAGRTVRLEPKAMAVLVFLAERPGQVVSREALLSAVWHGLVVSDDSLTQVVIKLRKALGDAAEQPAYIQTIPKGGYRLIAAVVRSAGVAPAPVVREPLSSEPSRRGAWIVAAGVTALLLATAVWWFNDERTGSAPPSPLPTASIEAARSAKPTVSVRPFEAFDTDPRAALLARGITADLVTDLSKVFGLSVITFGSVGDHAGSEMPADAQSIRYLVSGSVQRIGDRLRLHIHLTDTKSGQQLWSERFDRALSGFFSIQEELGPKILQMLPAKVSEAELRRVAQRHTRNLEAYEQFQRGQSALLVRQRAQNETARDMFRRAIALDPAFARAYAGLALTYAADYRNQWTADGAAALERAFELARSAHRLNPDIPETYWVLALVHRDRRQQEQALQHLETATRLYPSYADAYALMGSIKTYMGRPAEAVPLLLTAMRLDPQAGSLYFLNLGRAYFFLGDLEQSQLNLEHALSRNPENLEAHIYLAALHGLSGNKAAADWETVEIRALQPGFISRGWMETYPMTDIAQKKKLVQVLSGLGL